MKSQVLTLLLLIIGTLLIQTTQQYRLRKRELTEYDLTHFIVNTCSTDGNDVLIQNLCDQTLQSALMGNFPFLVYYCKMTGPGNRYCESINRHLSANPDTDIKRFATRRLARNINKLNRKQQETDTDIDLEYKEIIRKCLTNSNQMQQFCNKKLEEIQQGQYPEMKQFCQNYSDLKFCQTLLSTSWSSSSSSSSSSTPTKDQTFVSSKLSDVDAISKR